MTKALFTFNIRGTVTIDGKQVPFVKTNYLSMLQVISAYWEERESGAKVLSVFTNGATGRAKLQRHQDGRLHPTGETEITPGRTFTFAQSEGERFITHWEEFLEYMCFGPATTPILPIEPVRHQRSERGRRPMNVEIVEEEIIDSAPPNEGEAEFEEITD